MDGRTKAEGARQRKNKRGLVKIELNRDKKLSKRKWG
jgi:hypothetical protein